MPLSNLNKAQFNLLSLLIACIAFIAFLTISNGYNSYTDNFYYINYALDLYTKNFHTPNYHWEYRSFFTAIYYLGLICFGKSQAAFLVPPAFIFASCIFLFNKLLQSEKPYYSFSLPALLFLFAPTLCFFAIDLNITELGMVFTFLLQAFFLKQALTLRNKFYFFLCGMAIGIGYLVYAHLFLTIIPVCFIIFSGTVKNKFINILSVLLGSVLIFGIETIIIFNFTSSFLDRFFKVIAHKENTFFESVLNINVTLSDKYPATNQSIKIDIIVYLSMFLILPFITNIKKLYSYQKLFFPLNILIYFYTFISCLQIALGNTYILWRYFTPLYLLMLLLLFYCILKHRFHKKLLLLLLTYSITSFYPLNTDYFWNQKNLYDFDIKTHQTIYTNLHIKTLTPYYFIHNQQIDVTQTNVKENNLYYFHGTEYFNKFVNKYNVKISYDKNTSVTNPCLIAPIFMLKRQLRYYQKLLQLLSIKNYTAFNLNNYFIIWSIKSFKQCPK